MAGFEHYEPLYLDTNGEELSLFSNSAFAFKVSIFP